jgi:hypothetical protein
MKVKWKISILSTLLTVSFLSACNMSNNKFNDQNEVDYRPVRYENDTFPNDDMTNDNELNRTNRSFPHNESPDQTDERMEKGNDLQFDKDRGAD